MSQITIEGGSVSSVQNLLRKIGYENSRLRPAADVDRSVVITTQVKCVVVSYRVVSCRVVSRPSSRVC